MAWVRTGVIPNPLIIPIGINFYSGNMRYYFDLYEERGTGLVEPEFGKELCRGTI